MDKKGSFAGAACARRETEGMNLRKGILKLILCMLLALALPGAACGAESAVDVNMEISVGYDGMITYGKAMPVRVRIENNGADLSGSVCMEIYHMPTEYDRYEYPVQLAQGAARELYFPVTVNSKQESFTAELVCNGVILSRATFRPQAVVNPSAMLIGVLSDDAQAFSYMDVSSENDPLLRREYMQTVALTEESFPDDLDLLNAFGVIVVDGVDLTAMSDAQQSAMRQWLENGRIAIVSGGAQAESAWRFFEEYTSLKIGALAEHEDITPALTNYLGIDAESLNQTALLRAAEGGRALVTDGATPLIWQAQAGAGAVYTAAFDLGDKNIATWPAMRGFFQRLLLNSRPDLYESCFSSENGDYENMAYIPQNIPIENDSGMARLVAVIGAALIVVSFAAYFVLKKLDKRQYLWLVLPMITVLCAGGVFFSAKNSAFSRPVVLSTSCVRQDNNEILHYTNALAVATAEKGEHVLSASEGKLTPYVSRYYDYADVQQQLPAHMQYRYIMGLQSGVGVEFDTAWQTQKLKLQQDSPALQGKIETAIWREDDGMRGYLVNRTDVDFAEGVIISRLGYCSVPALAAGERYDFTLRSAQFADPDNQVYEDGCIYESLIGGYADTYNMINEYIYKTSQGNEDAEYEYDAEKVLRQSLMQVLINAEYNDSNDYYRMIFHYVAFCDELPASDVSIDGETIAHSVNRGAVSAVLQVSSVGNTGIVYCMPGEYPAYKCRVDEGGAPYAQESSDGAQDSYHWLKDKPTFAFDLSDIAEKHIDISRMLIYCETYSVEAGFYIYNGTEWVEQTLAEEIEAPEKYIDQNGMLYVQFRPNNESEEYCEICTPTILLEGQVK